MSDLSVNDHLEGILSDFEALKRSFDIEDVDEIPTFSPSSPLSSPFRPGPILNKSNEGRGPVNRVPPSYQSRISISSSPAQSPALKSKMVTSLSFNHGTLGTLKTNGSAGTGINRVSSFQSRLNPSGFSSFSGPGSDNDSLHSSSSSLEYQSSSRLGSFAGPAPSPAGAGQCRIQRLGSPALKKFSSHGNVFHSEVDAPAVMAAEPMGVNHGSMPSLDLKIQESAGVRGVAPLSTRYANAGVSRNSAPPRQQVSLGRVASFSSSHQPPKPKEPVRLGKFPLDLDSLVVKPQSPPAEPPKHLPRFQSRRSSPSPSLSSIDGAYTAPVHGNVDIAEPPPRSFPVPSVSVSPILLSPAQTPQLKLASQPQVGQLSPVTLQPDGELWTTQAKESGGSLLQRISSFSPVVTSDPGPRENDRCPTSEKRETPLVTEEFRKEEDTARGPEPQVQMSEREPEPEPVPVPAPVPVPVQRTCPAEPSTQGHIMGQDLFGYVGIEAVLDQMRRKAMKTGFEFNIMVVGQSGLGKSTLVNTLFKSKVSRKSCATNYEEKIPKTVNLQSVSHVIEEKGVKMKLTVIDTPGFGDQINNENCWEPIEKYINEQYEKYLQEELNINRKRRIPDTRVHCCVYFLPATGHWLRPIDVEFMKRLSKIVSVVPVIAKADTLTMEERLEFKQRIRHNLQANDIGVYPQTEYDEDQEDRLQNDKIRENIPFAVVGTDKEHQVNGTKVLGRKTKWGIIEVENVAHCEFANLRDLLIRSHLQDLKDVTHNIHYETYRVQRLNENNISELGHSALTPVNGTMGTHEAESQL